MCAVRDFVRKVSEDIEAFDINNIDENVTLDSNYFSVYRGNLVIRLYSDNLTSCGLSKDIILLNYNLTPNTPEDIVTLRHEYGHTVQAEKLGDIYYTTIFKSSIMYFCADQIAREFGNYNWYYNYFNMPWERTADEFGGIDQSKDRPDHPPAEWAGVVADIYFWLLERMKIFVNF